MLIVDLEASGIDHDVHSILSIGAIDFMDPERQFYGECRIWDGAHIMEEALEVNGFTKEEITDPNKPTERELLEDLATWMEESENHTIAGQNPHFDLLFLETAYQRNGMDIPLARRVIDLHSITFYHMVKRKIEPPLDNNRSDLNSDAVMEYVGIPAEPHPHNALNGALWEAEAFNRLFDEESLFEEFEEYPIPWI